MATRAVPPLRSAPIRVRPRTSSDLLAGAAAVLLALGGAAAALRLWRADLAVPFADRGDALFNTALVRALMEHGWWTHNPSLGAPAGQDLHDFAMGGDHVHLALLWALGHLTGSPGGGLNATFLLGFGLAAATAFAVLRWLGAGRPAAVTCAVLFALAPAAFLRGETHLLLALWPVPVGCWLALRAWRGDPLPARRPDLLLLLAGCALVASTGSFYFATFTVLLVGVGGAVAWATTRRAPVAAAVTVAAIAAVAAANLLPTALYALEHGRNDVVAARFASESEFHGLKLAQLLLPVQGHRIGALAELRSRYEGTSFPPGPVESSWSTLGLVASAGLVWLLAVLLAGRARVGERHRHLAGCALAAFLIGTVGGLGAIAAYTLTPQLRGWNRVSVFLAFFALAAVALLLDRAVRRGGARLLLLPAVLALGVLDQASPAFVPDHAGLQARFRAEERFVRAIEARTAPGAAILQLPVMRFPESGPVLGTEDYDHLRGTIHSARLRWSAGAMHGRPESWVPALGERPLPAVLTSAAAAGFTGLWVDRRGLPDRGRAVDAALGAPAAATADLAFWPLPRRSTSPGQRHATLRPLRLEAGRTDTVPLAAGEGRFGVRSPVLRLHLHNPDRRPRQALLRLEATRRAADAATIEVRAPGVAGRLRAGLRPGVLERRLVVPPGRSVVELRTTAAPAADAPTETGLAYALAASVTDEVLLEAPR